MKRDEAERLVDAMMQYNDAGMLNEFGAAYAELIAALCREPNQPEADRQRRIEECAKEIRYWHRMQADMGHAGKNLREILFRYIT